MIPMPLAAGDKLGPYEILAPLGAGGMGEVYKGRDTRLQRTIAIKILKPGGRERFEREARCISALNHLHICDLYDIGTQDGLDFLIMEYLEGDTLAQRLKRVHCRLSRRLPMESRSPTPSQRHTEPA
jgi:serine/threonine protein kinase